MNGFERFDRRWLDIFLLKLREESPRHWLVVEKTVFSNVKDKNVARRLQLSRQRIGQIRKEALRLLELMLSSAEFK